MFHIHKWGKWETLSWQDRVSMVNRGLGWVVISKGDRYQERTCQRCNRTEIKPLQGV